ncbi:hypothetical protein TpMuguga_01g00819 [Theileria parva strain Muguga]|uniref:Uncharacterized protein n=1 Tax=Theileria parva TaxID=5875 RepID=Q4N7K1_THEPA|nr:uncharacterized protein TpMuguga_01g00819 [Theileria parva strain Muguga]EAN34057.1 hypothetical protein TpMuguga_01g00819 [Theileria parva strain Muguga]|eukprot:XP_766340.1 hypothetical protein [Theileria parva strain Muguga]
MHLIMDFPSNSFSLSYNNLFDPSNSENYFTQNQNSTRNNLSDSFLSRNQSPFTNQYKTFNTDPVDSFNFSRMLPPRMNNLMHDFLNKSLKMKDCLSIDEELSLIENIINQQKALASVSDNMPFLELVDETTTGFNEKMKLYK